MDLSEASLPPPDEQLADVVFENAAASMASQKLHRIAHKPVQQWLVLALHFSI